MDLEMDPDEILDSDDEFVDLCGEIFRSKSGSVVFLCTLCDERFKNFNAYAAHINLEHNIVYGSEQFTDSGANFQEESAEAQQGTIEYIEDNMIEKHSDNEILKEEDYSVDDSDTLYSIYESASTNEGSSLESSACNNDVQKQNRNCEMPKVQNSNELRSDSAAVSSKSLRSTKTKTSDEIKDKLIEIPKDFREVRRLNIKPTVPPEDKKYKCPLCGLAFKEKHNMQHHLIRHSNDKHHECPECKKKFHTRSEVKIHMRCHTREKPFLCSDCGRRYDTNALLMQHIKRHTNQRDYVCSQCGKAFFDAGLLRCHMTIHGTERPFSCEICSASFVRNEALKNHKKLHANKNEYKCQVCGTGFNQKAGLFCHMKVKHKVINSASVN